MTKELVIKLATGLAAKVIRYALVAIGGMGANDSVTKDGVDVQQLGVAIGAILGSYLWSLWEDRIKKRAAASAVVEAAETGVPVEIKRQ